MLAFTNFLALPAAFSVWLIVMGETAADNKPSNEDAVKQGFGQIGAITRNSYENGTYQNCGYKKADSDPDVKENYYFMKCTWNDGLHALPLSVCCDAYAATPNGTTVLGKKDASHFTVDNCLCQFNKKPDGFTLSEDQGCRADDVEYQNCFEPKADRPDDS